MSLFTARVRSYFIKAGIPFREVAPVSRHFEDVVLPKAGGRRSMPIVELEDGTIIRDSVAITDHFEAANNDHFTPKTPTQKFISLLFDAVGAEGMYRPAMHYRWRYDENEALLRHHFEEITPIDAPYKFTLEGRFERMQQACNDLGTTRNLVELTESLYLELLKRLNTHFAQTPYLCGGKPCIGDFSLAAPMSAHLGRDIAPLKLLHQHAPYVLRWIERMQRPDPGFSAVHTINEDYLTDNTINDSLLRLLRHIATDFIPETISAATAINEWLAEQDENLTGEEVERGIGEAHFSVKTQTIKAAAQPFRFYLLQRLQSFFAGLHDEQQKPILELLEAVEMSALLDCKITRQIGRSGNLEVWL